jgi:hypothetical protein
VILPQQLVILGLEKVRIFFENSRGSNPRMTAWEEV